MEHEMVGKMQAKVAAVRHRNPARGLKIIAVAGARGKTTTALLLAEILQEAGSSVMVLTNQASFINGQPITRQYDSSADSVQRCLAIAKKKDVNYVIIEISDAFVRTHVLPTLPIEMSIITNASLSAQTLLGQSVNSMVVPSGFDASEQTVQPHQAINFGTDETADAQITRVVERRKGTEVYLVIDHQTKLPVATYLVGWVNALNVAAAVSAAYVLATDTATFEEGVARLERVIGNYDYVRLANSQYEAVVDAATAESSLELVLATAAKLKKRRLLVAVDSTVSTRHYTAIRAKADRLVVVGKGPEMPGVEQADSLQAALDVLTRSAKKDDQILLLGRDFAELDKEDSSKTKAHRMLEAKSE